jgi:4-hydroxy-tetrahydrodipicolinate synthase
VQSIKFGCELNGLNVGPVRAPLRPLNSEEQQTFQTVIANLKSAVAQITAGADNE